MTDQTAPEGGYQPDKYDDIAYWFWSIHPREIPDPVGMPHGYLGGARAWMYAKAIRSIGTEAADTLAAQQAVVDDLAAALENARLHHYAALCVVRGNLDDSYSAMADEMQTACDRWDAALAKAKDMKP